MGAYVEVWGGGASTLIPLDGERVTIGKTESNDIALTEDDTASRLHAVFERLGQGWCVRDLGSRNGTFVNNDRVWSDRALRPGDEIQVGQTRLVYRDNTPASAATATAVSGQAPTLTPRERDVLIALCRPLLAGDLFTEPAPIREIAAALVVTETAVKQHLAKLYDKFALYDADRRRSRLANEAVRRGAVSLSDLS